MNAKQRKVCQSKAFKGFVDFYLATAVIAIREDKIFHCGMGLHTTNSAVFIRKNTVCFTDMTWGFEPSGYGCVHYTGSTSINAYLIVDGPTPFVLNFTAKLEDVELLKKLPCWDYETRAEKMGCGRGSWTEETKKFVDEQMKEQSQ
jgi:hypothetical protein